MTKQTKRIASSEPIHKVVQQFLQLQISSAPVVDHSGATLGMISDEGLLKAFARSISSHDRVSGLDRYLDLLLPAKFVEASDTLSTVVSQMLACPTKRVLVHDDVHTIIGIISPKDILRALSGQKSSSLQGKIQDLEQRNKSLNSELHEHEKEFEKFHQILHDSPVMMFSCDQLGKITLANEMMIHFLGYEESGLVGKTIFEITPDTVHDQIRQNILNFDHQTKPKSDLISLQTHLGQKRRVEVSFSVMQQKNRPPTEVLIMAYAIDGDELLRALNHIRKS